MERMVVTKMRQMFKRSVFNQDISKLWQHYMSF